jgi:hypothetical protein
MAKFFVIGDMGYQSETVLFESEGENQAVAFAEKYIRWGDFGGYQFLSVGEYEANGDYVEVWAMDAPEDEEEEDKEA